MQQQINRIKSFSYINTMKGGRGHLLLQSQAKSVIIQIISNKKTTAQ
jgi:hypothetical protein